MQSILKTRGFLFFISIIFINAVVDLGHKIMIQNTIFKIYDGQEQIVLISIINGLIILPFVLLFSPAGFISDKYNKPLVMKVSAAVAVALTLLITLSYYMGWFYLSFGLTFLLAMQSALYSPAKYGYIKELLGKEKLTVGNAFVQATTIVAILAGIFMFSMYFESSLAKQFYQNESDVLKLIAPAGWLLVILSAIEFLFTCNLPVTHAGNNEQQFNLNDYAKGNYLVTNIKKIYEHRIIWLSIVGLSVFWGISQVVLASFPAYAKDVLGIDNTVLIQGIIASTGIGIIIGSLIAGRASRTHIETGLIPLGAVGIVIGMLFITRFETPWLLIADFMLFGVAGGMFIVPLNSLIQFHAKQEELGVVLAGNNWVQNVVMLSFLSLTVVFALFGANSQTLFILMTLTAVIGAAYTVYCLPQSMVRYVIGRVFSSQYRIQVIGLDNMPNSGGVLLLGNHISWLDWAMIQIACPRPVRFVMHRSIYQKWYIKWFVDFFGVIPIAGGRSKESLQQINQLLKDGEVVCLFPEGAISRNGQLGEFKKGYEKVVEEVDGVIIPFYLRGLWGSRFSNASEKLQEDRNPSLRGDVVVTFGKPLSMETVTTDLKQRVFELSRESWSEYSNSLNPIALEWLRTAKQRGSELCLADAKPEAVLSTYKTTAAVLAFSRLIKKYSQGQNVGLLLPTSSAGVITNLAVLLLGKTVINLNYTANLTALKSAVEKGEIKTIYTSRKFVDKLVKKGIVLDELFEQLDVYYLEELKDEITLLNKVSSIVATVLLPADLIFKFYGKHVSIDSAATILFSSGSEGTPKGVVLSHRNLVTNVRQVADMLDTVYDDVIMNSLPLFHAFGLTVTTLMPLIEGVPVVCHPDPTDTITIAKAIARFKATIFCGTSTFIGMFTRNRRVHPLMLQSLRIVVAGAERLNKEVRAEFKLKFQKEIYEGYGATETSPVASVNVPDRLETSDWHIQSGSKLGTVGLPLPGTSFRVVDPESYETLATNEDGLILISGEQVMTGYLNDPEKTVENIIELDGYRWYKTGDKGHLDEDGYLTIVDRYSRFAKIGGEMVSLGAIESGINELIPEGVEILATAIPDGKKGEKVILLYTNTIQENQLKELIDNAGLNPLMKPAKLLAVDAIPKLGSGKNDLNKAKEIALNSE